MSDLTVPHVLTYDSRPYTLDFIHTPKPVLNPPHPDAMLWRAQLVNLQSEAPEGHVLKVRALLLTKEWDAAIAAAHTAAEAHRGDRSVMEVNTPVTLYPP